MDEKNYFLCMRTAKGVQYFLAENGKWYRTAAVFLPGTDTPRDPFLPRPPIVRVFTEEAATTTLKESCDLWSVFFPEAEFSVYSAPKGVDPFGMLRGV